MNFIDALLIYMNSFSLFFKEFWDFFSFFFLPEEESFETEATMETAFWTGLLRAIFINTYLANLLLNNV